MTNSLKIPKLNVVDEKELKKLYETRVRDRKSYRTKRWLRREEAGTPLNALLNYFFRNDPEAIKKLEENRAILAWQDYVGTSTTHQAKAVRIVNNRLIVVVGDPLWRQELMMMRTSLLKKYQKDFPSLNLRDIYFVAYDRG